MKASPKVRSGASIERIVMGPYSLPGRCVLASLLVLLLGAGGCLEGLCGPGDSTFPCLRTTLPKWGVHEKGHPYQDQTQGDVYKAAFGDALRVTPWEII
jgi:hypothetical protein